MPTAIQEKVATGFQEDTASHTLRLGSPAPLFEAETTHGRLRLEHFSGSWVMLFSHAPDSIPVCINDLLAFAQIAPELKHRSVELLCVGMSSACTHTVCMRDIEEKFGIDIPFPVIADAEKGVASLYGMIPPGKIETEISRRVFVIDPNGILRAMICGPLITGRILNEILRLVDVLRTTDGPAATAKANSRAGATGTAGPRRGPR